MTTIDFKLYREIRNIDKGQNLSKIIKLLDLDEVLLQKLILFPRDLKEELD